MGVIPRKSAVGFVLATLAAFLLVTHHSDTYAGACYNDGWGGIQCEPDDDPCMFDPDLCLNPPPPPPAPQPEQSTGKSKLKMGEWLEANTYLISPNGAFRLSMQTDGNLVLYRNSDGYVPWASGTYGAPGLRLVLQYDGNLVLYDGANNAYWAAGTNPTANAYLAVQDEGNLVIYGQQPIWASNSAVGDCGVSLSNSNNRSALQALNSSMPRMYGAPLYSYSLGANVGVEELRVGQQLTSQNGCYSLVFQQDFNLVVYRNTDGFAFWASDTVGKGAVASPSMYANASGSYNFDPRTNVVYPYPTRRVVVQMDGNVVMYSYTTNSNDVPWSTNTWESAGRVLIMQDDGNLVLYTDIVPVWAQGRRISYAVDHSPSFFSRLPCIGISYDSDNSGNGCTVNPTQCNGFSFGGSNGNSSCK